MRQKRTAQQSQFNPEPVCHPVADTLEAVSAWLDATAADLGTGARGRAGLKLRDGVALRSPQAPAPGDLAGP